LTEDDLRLPVRLVANVRVLGTDVQVANIIRQENQEDDRQGDEQDKTSATRVPTHQAD
jgi:hypothetical protein